MDELPEIRRKIFFKILENEVGEALRNASNLGLLLVDLSNLTRINHHLGYQAGDRLLAETYKHLLGVSKLPDTVFRIGSHHFVFLLPDLSNPAFIALAMNKIYRVLQTALAIDEEVASVDVKIGVAINREGRRSAMEMLATAETSLAQVRRGGSLQIEDLIGDEPETPADMQLEQLFAETLHENAFELYYQPKINLSTGEATCAEALLRWQVEGRGFISPEIAVELADNTGRAYSLTKWVVHTALRQIRQWQDSIDISVALNVQADLVNSPDLLTLLTDAIAIWGVKPHRVTIEITESAIIVDKESGFDNLLKIKQLGVDLAIDDFGTGYSSLSYFKHIPANELKIDQSFVRSMRTDPQDLELVKIIIHIAHKFGLSVVAEGVEDEESLQLLCELGCDFAQGYYFSEPLPREEFEAWVSAWSGF